MGLKVLEDKDYQGIRGLFNKLAYQLYKEKKQFKEALYYLELYNTLAIQEASEKEKNNYEQAAARLGLKAEEERSYYLAQELSAERRLQSSLLVLGLLGFICFILGLSHLRKQRQVSEAQKRIRGMMKQIKPSMFHDVPAARAIWKSLLPYWIPTSSRAISSIQACLQLHFRGQESKCGSFVMNGAEPGGQ